MAIMMHDINLNSRMTKLREECVNTDPAICVERARLITEAYKKYPEMPIQEKRALALKHILSNMSIYIRDGELLAGNHSSALRAAPMAVEYDIDFIREEIDTFPTRSGDRFEITEENKKELLEICDYWQGKTLRERVLQMIPDETRIAGEDGVGGFDSAWTLYNGDGHISPDYPKVLRLGFNGIIAEIDERSARLDLSNPEDLEKLYFLKAVRITSEAVIEFAQRFSDLAAELACKAGDYARKAELLEISRMCAKVPAEPAETFYEALQSLWLAHLATQIDNNGHSVSFGRFDQYMYSYYKADTESGRMDVEQAIELLQSFWLKLNEMVKLRPKGDANLFPGYPMFQNLTIGGQTRDGKDAVNDLTYLCLVAQGTVKLSQPNLTARVHINTPDKYLMECGKLIRMGMGFPSLFCDEVVILSMMNRGVAIEDAYDYCLVGCVEPSVQGKWGGRYGAANINLTKILELALYGGEDPVTGLVSNPSEKNLSNFKNIEEVKDAWKRQIDFYVRQRVIRDNIQDTVWKEMAPVPLIDSLVEGCIERGKGIKDGGAIYDFTGGQTGNIANVANSLVAIKQLVFEQKKFTGKELLDALRSNYEGVQGEKIREMILNVPPKFGNDDDEVDGFAKELFTYYMQQEPKYKNTRYGKGPIGGVFVPSTASISANVPFGLQVGATPDGRKAFEPVADVLSPYHGTDTNGPTATIKSVAKLDNYLLSGGAIFNVKFTPSLLENDEGLRKMVSLIRSYFRLGGMQIQFNVVSRALLIDAQQEPEKHKDLIVRVAGYSAYFVVQDPLVQNDIIARTEHKSF